MVLVKVCVSLNQITWLRVQMSYLEQDIVLLHPQCYQTESRRTALVFPCQALLRICVRHLCRKMNMIDVTNQIYYK